MRAGMGTGSDRDDLVISITNECMTRLRLKS